MTQKKLDKRHVTHLRYHKKKKKSLQFCCWNGCWDGTARFS